ncbi:hypothetical protein [Nostoc parmelioides]|uniref:Uncharacterized protein n=1 Tax=Nostoc parmelioides FACHB-3921 TaxID=2692909 RepID=A0ABR8BBY6_9NOSO|nr:hypothetical protein [Nostoc parmelioides]MBD2250391.1 hypothetical protein [Nostoc parmelioides FACHB-3921]
MLNDGKKSLINQANALYRHGDVLLRRINSIPNAAQKRVGTTLAHGEVTGHSHRIRESHGVQVWVYGSEMFLEVKQASATLIHEEHRAIELPQGLYRVWRQREYRPDAYVEVED